MLPRAFACGLLSLPTTLPGSSQYSLRYIRSYASGKPQTKLQSPSSKPRIPAD
jgi:hypothetical protein